MTSNMGDKGDKVSMVVGNKRLTINTSDMTEDDVSTLMTMSKQTSTGAGLEIGSVLSTKKSEMAALKESQTLKKCLCFLSIWTLLLGVILFCTVILAIFITKDMKPDDGGILVTKQGAAIGTAQAQKMMALTDLLDPSILPDLTSLDFLEFNAHGKTIAFKVLSTERQPIPSEDGFKMKVKVKGFDIQLDLDSNGKLILSERIDGNMMQTDLSKKSRRLSDDRRLLTNEECRARTEDDGRRLTDEQCRARTTNAPSGIWWGTQLDAGAHCSALCVWGEGPKYDDGCVYCSVGDRSSCYSDERAAILPFISCLEKPSFPATAARISTNVMGRGK